MYERLQAISNTCPCNKKVIIALVVAQLAIFGVIFYAGFHHGFHKDKKLKNAELARAVEIPSKFKVST